MNPKRSIFLAALFLALSVESGWSQSSSRLKDATVLIIRHAEKPESGKHLSPAGIKRAEAYVAYFKSLRIDSHPVKLEHLFAAKESAHSDRSRETLLPLSKTLNLKIHSEFDVKQVQELTAKVLTSYSGGSVLICWHHGKIPDLINALGADPKDILPRGEWPDEVFGWLIVLQYNQRGEISAKVYNEGLVPEDAKHPAPVKQ